MVTPAICLPWALLTVSDFLAITTTMDTTEQIAEAFTSYIEENAKFILKGNKSAGVRARKALLELTKLAKARRAEISEEKAASTED